MTGLICMVLYTEIKRGEPGRNTKNVWLICWLHSRVRASDLRRRVYGFYVLKNIRLSLDVLVRYGLLPRAHCENIHWLSLNLDILELLLRRILNFTVHIAIRLIWVVQICTYRLCLKLSKIRVSTVLAGTRGNQKLKTWRTAGHETNISHAHICGMNSNMILAHWGWLG